MIPRAVSTTLLVLVLLTAAHSALAQEIYLAGPLAGAPAVRHLVEYRRARISVAPTVSFTINDSYRREILLGARAEFSLFEWLAIGVFGQLAPITLDTGLAEQLRLKSPGPTLNHPNNPMEDMSWQFGTVRWFAGGQIQVIPLRGKFSFFNLFLDIDLYAVLGAGFIGVEERVDADLTNYASLAGQRSTRVAGIGGLPFAPVFGAGMSIFISDLIALGIEWRGLWFTFNASGTDECCVDGRQFPDSRINELDRLPYFTQTMTISVAFFLPPKSRRSN